MAELTPWVVVALAAMAAVTLYLRVRAAGVEAAATQLDAEKLRAELESTRQQLAKSAAKQRRATDETQELRRKLDKAKKRAGRSAGAAPGAAAARVSALEADLEQARQTRDAAREEAAAIGAELSRLRAEAANARRKEQKQQEEKAATAPRTGPPEPGAVMAAPEVPRLDNAAIEALQARVAATEAELSAARTAIAEHGRATERLRGKLSTQEALYVSMRSELAAKKDRLRTQQEEIERLLALKVALVDAPLAEQTTPVAADGSVTRARESEPASASSDAPKR